MEGLKIEIGANIQAALTQMVKLTAAVEGLDKSTAGVGKNLAAIPAALRPINSNALKGLSDAVNRLKTDLASAGGIKSLPTSLNAIPPAANAAAASLNRIRPGSDQATNSLMNLGRVVQDAPFGFIGIANNISPLFESFERLGKSAGGLGGAMRALGTSLMGAGGIGLALAAFQFIMLDGVGTITKFFNKTKELSEEEKKLAETLRSSQESLQRQLLSVESLVRVATSDVSTKKQQADALSKLNELIPDNVGVLTAQNLKMTEGVGIIKAYTQALIAQATAELYTNRAAEVRAKQFEQSNTAKQDLSKLFRERRELQTLLQTASKSTAGGITIGGAGGQSTESEFEKITKRLVALDIQIQTFKDGVLRARIETGKELNKFVKEIDKNLAGSVQLDTADPKPLKIDKAKAKEDEDIIATRIKQLEELKNVAGLLKKEEFELLDLKINLAVRDQGKNGLNADQLQRSISALIKGADLNAGIEAKIILKNPALAKANINTMLATQGRPLEMDVEINPKMNNKLLKDQLAGLNQAIQSSLISGIEGIAVAIGEAVAGQGNPFQGFISMLADGMAQIGKAAITVGVIGSGLIKAIEGMQWQLALGLGIALVAASAALKSTMKATKFATGGIVTGPTNAIIGEGGQPEVIFPLRDLNKFIGNIRKGEGGEGYIAETNISGDHLNILLRRSNNRFGGSLS